jgi:hypothetical protein
MTLEGWVRKRLRKRYSECFTHDSPTYSIVCIDIMQFIKGSLPEHIKTMPQMRDYLYSKVHSEFKTTTGCQIVVLCFDKGTPDVKSMICHKTRYEIRCKECKTLPLPYGKTAGREYFAESCTKDCINKQILWFDEGPYIVSDQLPDWKRYSSDNNNLRRSFYPHVWNWFLDFVPPPGKLILLHGLPGNERIVTDESFDFNSGHHVNRDPTTRIILVPFQAHQLPLPVGYDYDNVYVIEHIPYPENRIRREKVPEMRNSILEADNAVFFYSQFYPQFEHFMAYINDGDAISIGLLRAKEDLYKDTKKEHWIALRLTGEEKTKYSYAPSIEYVNLTLLAQKIEESPEFVSNGFQSPIATMVFLIILSGTDFFGGDFCHGIGRESGVWDVFFSRLDMFHHMVQYYVDMTSYTKERRMVLDEELFAIFTKLCYTKKYEKAAKGTPIEIYCSKLKKKQSRYPTEDEIRLYGRQSMWNGNYWANACRNITVDPFERHMNASYWGYDGETKTITKVTAKKQKKVDEVHKRHFWKRQQKLNNKQIPEKRVKSAIDAIKGL